MSYNDQLNANNEALQAILNKVNALPDAGASGGGGTVETCEVVIDVGYEQSYRNGVIYYSDNYRYIQYINEQMEQAEISGITSTSVPEPVKITCIKGSPLLIVSSQRHVQIDNESLRVIYFNADYFTAFTVISDGTVTTDNTDVGGGSDGPAGPGGLN